MQCPKCNGPATWQGSLSRGGLVCLKCDGDPDKSWHYSGGMCTPTMRRYYDEVQGWHRDWCQALINKKLGRTKGTDPNFCTCGHAQKTPYTEQQIEQKEVANYGYAV